MSLWSQSDFKLVKLAILALYAPNKNMGLCTSNKLESHKVPEERNQWLWMDSCEVVCVNSCGTWEPKLLKC